MVAKRFMQTDIQTNDRQTDTDMTKLKVTFCNFVNKPKNNDKKQKLHKTREVLT